MMTVDNKFVDFLKQKFSKLFADKSEFQTVKEDVNFLTEGGGGASYVHDNGNKNHITFQYSGDGLTSYGNWMCIWNGYSIRAMHKDVVAKSMLHSVDKTVSWTFASSGGIYYHEFNPYDLWNIATQNILHIGIRTYSGSWRYLNFQRYGDNKWVVLSNLNTTLSGTIIITYMGQS